MRLPYRHFAAAALAALSILSSDMNAAFAAQVPDGGTVTEPENQACGNEKDMLQAIADIESFGGRYDVTNKQGFLGKYQVGEAKLQDLGYAVKDGNAYDNKFRWTDKARQKFGISSTQDFLSNPQAQEAIYQELTELNRGYLRNIGAYKHIGQPTPCKGNPPLTENMLLAAGQLGHGAVDAWLKNGMQCNAASTDGNGTCVDKFVCAVGGCGTVQKDMSKKTCDVTMPMIQGISCSNFSGSMQSFCQTYRPYLMTRGECESAEAMAQSAPKGPNREKCENQTFGVGTGSWSYVLACSYASSAVADQDGESNPGGPVSDPACMEKLRGMGVDFDILGQVQNGTYGGTTCTIQNAVSLRGTALPFGAKLTMTCEMAVAMEQYGQKMKGQGASSYFNIGSTRPCGPMIDGNGPKQGTITEHAIGRAVDAEGFIVGGRKVSMGNIFSPGTPDGRFATAAKDIACTTFRGVLSPTYGAYKKKYVHFHLEWGKMSGVCR